MRTAGSFIAPNAYFSGTDSFQYKANDGTPDSNVATVTILVRHVEPAAGGNFRDGGRSADGGGLRVHRSQRFPARQLHRRRNHYAADIGEPHAVRHAGHGGAVCERRGPGGGKPGIHGGSRPCAPELHLPGRGQRQHGGRRRGAGSHAEDAYLRPAAGRARSVLQRR